MTAQVTVSVREFKSYYINGHDYAR